MSGLLFIGMGAGQDSRTHRCDRSRHRAPRVHRLDLATALSPSTYRRMPHIGSGAGQVDNGVMHGSIHAPASSEAPHRRSGSTKTGHSASHPFVGNQQLSHNHCIGRWVLTQFRNIELPRSGCSMTACVPCRKRVTSKRRCSVSQAMAALNAVRGPGRPPSADAQSVCRDHDGLCRRSEPAL